MQDQSLCKPKLSVLDGNLIQNENTMLKPTERFSDRVANYINFRPSYPAELIERLRVECRLDSSSVIADIGSGTGKLSELFIQKNISVFAVEPNKEMREAADSLFGTSEYFSSVCGESADTTLSNSSIDLVTIAQALHWFEPVETKKELERILKPNGQLAIIWNERNTNAPFQKEYDQMLTELAPEYTMVNHRNITDSDIDAFCSPRRINKFSFAYSQQFDLEGLIGRMNSSSYTPAFGTKEHDELNAAAERLFKRHEVNGEIEFYYDTKLYLS